MAYTLLTGQSITLPKDFCGMSLGLGFSGNAVIDATGEKVAMTGNVWWPSRSGTKSIRKIHFRFGAVTKAGGSGLTVSLQNVLTASGSGPVPDETQDETVSITNGDTGFVTASWYTTGNLSADRSVSFGETLSVVWEYDGGGRLGSDSVVIAGTIISNSETKDCLPSTSLKTGGTWSVTTAVSPNVVFEFSDGTFGCFSGTQPIKTINTHSFKQDTAGVDEYALKWVPAFNCKCDGAYVRVNAGTTADFDVVLYDGTTAIKTYSVDANTVAGLPTRPLNIPWEQITLSAGSIYRLAIKPTQTAANVTVYSTDVNSVDHMVLLPGGPEMCHSTRVDGGAWSDTSTRRLFGFGFSISSIDDGASSGGGARMVNIRGGADQ